MLDIGYDLQNEKKRRLTSKLVKSADIILVTLSDPDIKERLPNYIKLSSKTRFWDLKFNPPSRVYGSFPPSTYNYHIQLVVCIKKNVEKLVAEVG